MRVGVQADDLTGACDTGVVFAARGLETLVLLPGTPLPPACPPVVVRDTESRGLAAGEAEACARAAMTELAVRQPALLYKKVDSTLRGAVAAELAGALTGGGCDRTLLAPAFPAQGRSVRHGRLHVRTNGATSDDARASPDGASVLALVAAGGPRPVSLLPLATVRRGVAAVRARLARVGGTMVADSENAADLDVLAAADDGASLLAGSAGLATALAARLGSPLVAPVRPRGPLLVVAGSPHPVTRGQVARLEARGGHAITAASGIEARAGEAIAGQLAEATRRRLEEASVATLVLTGGATAYSVCRALRVSAIRLATELEPGLALGTLVGGPFAGLSVITKSGGFGDADTLVRIWESCQ
jgi:D-threonate/D-erythronate kinase